jgi:hypothetical protein
MHTNFAGLTELLCRLGCTCSPSTQKPGAVQLAGAKLLVIPTPTGSYNVSKECWSPKPESLFTAENITDVFSFVQNGGRLLAFAYRFGDWFTRANLRDLISPFGCLLNDDAVIDLQTIRGTNPLEAFFDTPTHLLPLRWSREGVCKVRWRTMATFTILPGANVRALVLSPGGTSISFNRSIRRISFASLPVAVAGATGKGRFAFFGGPHGFENGKFGLLAAYDNARFLQNVVRWLLDDGQPDLKEEPTVHYRTGTFFFNNGLDVIRSEGGYNGEHTVAYVERLLRKSGVLRALAKPRWMP